MSININDFRITEEYVEKALQPTDEVAREYMNPILDDTWVRQADLIDVNKLKVGDTVPIVQSSNVKLTNHGEVAVSDHCSMPQTSTLGELERQEAFMRSYKESKLSEDIYAATSYKSQMLENFRKKREQQYQSRESHQ